MVNLINIQKGKHYGQILFDHNAENIEKNTVYSDEVCYRRNELKRRKWYLLIGALVIIP